MNVYANLYVNLYNIKFLKEIYTYLSNLGLNTTHKIWQGHKLTGEMISELN